MKNITDTVKDFGRYNLMLHMEDYFHSKILNVGEVRHGYRIQYMIHLFPSDGYHYPYVAAFDNVMTSVRLLPIQ